MQLRVKAVAYISLLERHFKPKKKGSLRTHLSCKKNNLIQVVDLDNYKLNTKVKQIVELSSFPIFSDPVKV